ncbi:hypothetical protein N0V94_008384 [Neodidymelliopsis sp. IMI 364377]|nr:hypothetical protein N0V94_008384 [Neodidymelliopsis sp. IMI 364377]
MTQTSKRSQRGSHNPYRDHDDNTHTNPFADEKHSDSDDQTQLSPMFVDYLRKKTAATDLEKINTQLDTNDRYRGTKIAHTVSPVDGKTMGCDRFHTFDAFVDQRRLSDDAGNEKRVGHGWQLARALKRVMSSKGRGTNKSRHANALPQGLAA